MRGVLEPQNLETQLPGLPVTSQADHFTLLPLLRSCSRLGAANEFSFSHGFLLLLASGGFWGWIFCWGKKDVD